MTSVPTPSIGVVTINWNELEHTLACLVSVLQADPGPTRVIVVDNASADGSADALAHWIAERGDPRVTLVRSPVNRGFADGSNVGVAELVRAPTVSHFLLLNNDATLEPTFFAELARALGAAPNTAILGATIYWGDGRERVWYAGGRLPRLRAMATHGRRVPPRDEPVPTEFVTGCAFLIARSAWEQLGPIPDCYFIYFEDAEYCRRARDAGLRVAYAPRAVLHHAVAGTLGRERARAQGAYWFNRARALYVRRNLRGWRRWGALAYVIASRPAVAALEALRGHGGVAWAQLRGAAAGLWA
jgi:hypothetical protein